MVDLIPASSPLCSLIISNLHFFFSTHFEYILLNIWAQSWLSVPPAPACISKYVSKWSFSPDKKQETSVFFIWLSSKFVFFSQSFITATSFSLEANSKSCSKFSNSFTTKLKFLIIFSKNFFSFKIFCAENLSFQKFSWATSLSNFLTFSLILFLSKIPPDIIYNFFCLNNFSF